jgi:hypothetical protein
MEEKRKMSGSLTEVEKQPFRRQQTPIRSEPFILVAEPSRE